MSETLTLKNGQIIYTRPDNTEASATGMVARSGKTYSFKTDKKEPGKGKPCITPCDIFEQDGYIAVVGHVNGTRVVHDIFTLKFPGFNLSAFDLEHVQIISPPVSPARLSVVPARPDKKNKKSGMIPPFGGWFRS